MVRVRRIVIGGVILAMAANVVASASADAAGGMDARYQKLQSVAFTDVKITDEFWSPRVETNRVKTVWHSIKKCEETGRISNFAKAGGLMEGEFEGIYFNDSDVYKVIEGAAYCLHNQEDPVLDAKLDEIIHKIASAQQDDGYLFTFNTLKLKNDVKQRWRDLQNEHELYCAGHLFEGAVAHYRATGKKTFLNVAARLADHIDSVFGPNGKRGVPGHEEIELALVKLARVTGEERYLKLSQFFLDERGNANGRKLFGPHFQDHKPVREQSEIVGHAVRAMYLYSGVADMAGITGDEGYIKAMDRLWDSVAAHKMYITGGIGVADCGEGFSKDYELPNAKSYAETCASVGMALWSHRLNLLHGDASYFDVFERVLYNGLMSGVSLDGEKFFYVNLLESDKGTHERTAWFGCSCCPSNIVRFVGSVGGYIYAVDDDGVYVNLYVGSTGKVAIGNNTVKLTQETRYPWDGKIKLIVEPGEAKQFAVNLRIPGWSRGAAVPNDLYRFADGIDTSRSAAQLKVNGKTMSELDIHKGYVRLHRKWKKGDVVELDIPMPIRRVAAHAKVEADVGRVALQRGPIVYCLEEADNGDNLRYICLPDEGQLTSEYRGDLLGGVVVVKGKAMVRSGDDGRFISKDISAVPYYSWNNRQTGKMIVWLPREAEYVPVMPEPTIASRSEVSASHCWGSDSVEAINDQIEPENSNDNNVPRFTWWDHRGGKEWVQYDLRDVTKVSSSSVYWFDDGPGGGCRTPESWRLMYKDSDQWKPVAGASGYSVGKDKYNRVTFDAVETDGLRIEVELQKGFSGGILEWKVNK